MRDPARNHRCSTHIRPGDVHSMLLRRVALAISFLLGAGCAHAVEEGTKGTAGSACATTQDCAAGAYCKLPEGSCGRGGAHSAAGECTTIPEICNKMYLPVCGCDGTTYGNECSAAAKGVSVRAKGSCPGPGAGA